LFTNQKKTITNKKRTLTNKKETLTNKKAMTNSHGKFHGKFSRQIATAKTHGKLPATRGLRYREVLTLFGLEGFFKKL